MNTNTNTKTEATTSEPKTTEAKAEGMIKKALGNPWVTWTIGAAAVAIIILVIIYFKISNSQVYIDQASIIAPQITLSPSQPDILQDLYVQPGDTVTANETVAQVGNQLIQTKVAGEVIATDDSIGKLEDPGDPVVTMIDPSELRVVGQLDEDKGLDNVKVGQTVYFTVDAFGGEKFAGIVDEVAPTSNQSDVVFSISTGREEQQFDIKVRYDVAAYPELKNGMSARIWIFK